MQQRYKFGKKTAIILSHTRDGYGNVFCKIFDTDGSFYKANIPLNQLVPIVNTPVKSQVLRGRTISGPSCADCGTGENMGFMQGVKCPNCEGFKEWLNSTSKK